MAPIPWSMVFRVAVRLAITVLFVPAILAKLRHPQAWAALFSAWGCPSWGAIVVSSAEIASLIALWIPRLALLALGVEAITLSGAVFTWLVHGPRATAAYPGTILLLVGLRAWLEVAVKARTLNASEA